MLVTANHEGDEMTTKAESDARIEKRIRTLHEATCQNWETWTEKNVPQMGGGRSDMTFDGCRKHNVAVAR